MSTILTERRDDILIITIDRPRIRNAVDIATGKALLAAVTDFENDAELKVAILTGAEDNFCAGADLKAIDGGLDVMPWEPSHGHGPLGPSWCTPQKPVIAAVEGYAVAGGLELAIWCDLRVAARNATFGVFCRRWGVPLMDGGTVRLPRLIGRSRALDMILTGRPVSGEEAYTIGLANRLVEPGQALEEALRLARTIAGHPQACMLLDRASVHNAEGLSLDQAIDNEGALAWEYLRDGMFLDGVKRFNRGAGRHGEGA